MIKEINADIFTVPTDLLVHQCNCFHIMGGGIARVIKKLFPEAYQADLSSPVGEQKKLGWWTAAAVKNEAYPHIKTIVNLYGQFDIAAGERATNYDALDKGFRRMIKHFDRVETITVPYGIGCGLGLGRWPIVSAILKDVFEHEKVQLVICEK